MAIYEEIVQLSDQLSMLERVRLIEHLSAILEQQLEKEAFARMDWHEFIEHTAGILTDDPIERPAQLPLEEREDFE